MNVHSSPAHNGNPENLLSDVCGQKWGHINGCISTLCVEYSREIKDWTAATYTRGGSGNGMGSQKSGPRRLHRVMPFVQTRE